MYVRTRDSNTYEKSMPVRINGPLTSGEEGKKLNLVIPGGHALVSTIVDAGLGKQRFARYFSSSIGTRGIVIVGLLAMSRSR